MKKKFLHLIFCVVFFVSQAFAADGDYTSQGDSADVNGVYVLIGMFFFIGFLIWLGHRNNPEENKKK